LGDIFIIKRGASPRPIQNYLAKKGVNWIKIGDIETNAKYITKTQEKRIPEGAKKAVKVSLDQLLD
jgi:type I restriction enzyme S subunit